MTYDYIFTGAGCAGLSLVSLMSKDTFFDDKSILLIDAAPKNQNDRTWCFWSKTGVDAAEVAHRNWGSLHFKSNEVDKIESIAPYQYHHVKGIDFYQQIKHEICGKKNITWCQDEVLSLYFDQEYGYIKTSSYVYKAPVIFNSILGLSELKSDSPQLYQHFFGYRIKTTAPLFDVQSVRLMDFTLSKHQNEVQFGYIIPFGSQEALVEFTEFSNRHLSDDAYRAELSAYLKKMGISTYEIIEQEKGRIPMAVHNFQRQEKRMVNIGTAGGMTKPTTGYTFRNIQQDSRRLLEGLKTGQIHANVRAHARFNFYDRLLLGIIRDEPQQVQKIMSRLFKRNKMRNILKFLDEQTNILEEIRIFFSIPWAPFLRQLTKR